MIKQLKVIFDFLREQEGFYRYLGLLSLTLISWIGVLLFGSPGDGPKKPSPGRIDYYARGLQRTVMDTDGKPKEYLVADEQVHFDGDNHSDFTSPVMTLYVKDGPPWVIHSQTATVPGEGDELYLHGDVLVTREADKNGKTMRIETTNARVQPDRRHAETDEHILVLSPPDTMTGVGARVNFGDVLQYTILSEAHRKHEVESEPDALSP